MHEHAPGGGSPSTMGVRLIDLPDDAFPHRGGGDLCLQALGL